MAVGGGGSERDVNENLKKKKIQGSGKKYKIFDVECIVK